jgi:uncharacterized protein HemX
MKSNKYLFLWVLSILFFSASLLCFIYDYKEIIKLKKNINQANLIIKNNTDNIKYLSQINEYNEHKVNNIESQINKFTSSTRDFSLLQVNELVSLANQILSLYTDVTSTLRILEYINKLLENNNRTDYIRLKIAINSDISNLDTLQKINIYSITTKINLLSDLINNLPLNIELGRKNNVSNEIKQYNNNEDLSILQKFWQNMKHDISQIVIISKITKKDEIETLPEKEVIIRQNIKLDTLSLKIALLQRNDKLWHYYLNAIKIDIMNYVVKNDNVASILNLINELDAVNINFNYTLEKTNNALNLLNNNRLD